MHNDQRKCWTAKVAQCVFEIVEEYPGGFYVYRWDSEGKNTHDHLQDDLPMAKHCALEEFGVQENLWESAPPEYIPLGRRK